MILHKIFIIIPVHNRKEFTQECLVSLQKQTEKNFEVIIVDDGSTDGTSEMIQSQFSEVILLKGDGNLWWTAATNLGVKYALNHGASYILTLNNDTIASNNFIEKMIYWAEKTPDSLLGAFAVDINSKRPVYGGEIINWWSASYKSLLNVISPDSWHGLHEVTHFPGRGLFIPSKVFEKIGLYDEINFPHYVADYDFTHKAKRAGFKIFCNYDAKLKIYPEESGGVRLRKKKSIRNYYNHLFGIKGAANLLIFTKYALANCPTYLIPSFLLVGLLKRIFGYFLHD